MNKLSAAVNAAHQAEQRAQSDLRTAQNATGAATALKAQLVQQGQALQAQLAPLIAARNRLSAAQQATLANTGVQGVFIAPPGIRGAAMNIALAQRGKPYQWAGAGPANFDCSGLVLYAYAQAGLPHSAAAHATMGVPVARADLQPGGPGRAAVPRLRGGTSPRCLTVARPAPRRCRPRHRWPSPTLAICRPPLRGSGADRSSASLDQSG